jgi:hypothetical protein
VTKLWGTGPANLFAISGSDISHYDGITWSPMKSTTQQLWGIGGVGRRFFAVGETGTLLGRGTACRAQETQCGDGRDDDCEGRSIAPTPIAPRTRHASVVASARARRCCHADRR